MSSIPRLVFELAPTETERALGNLITAAARKQLLDPFKAEATLQRHARRPGITKARAAFDAYLPREDRKSGLEISFAEALRRNPDIPPHHANFAIPPWEIDCWWPRHRVAVELDGRPYHVAVADTERDRIKDAKLMGMGIWPLRVTDLRWSHEPAAVLNDLRKLLRRREEELRAAA